MTINQIPPAGSLHFAYGSNLDPENWATFCEHAGISPDELVPFGPAYLPDHREVFDYFSSRWQAGALNVEPAVGFIVEGYLFRPTERAWAALNRKEGNGNAYLNVPVTTIDRQSGEVDAYTYVVMDHRRAGRFIAPSTEYLEICQKGRTHWGLDIQSLLAAAEGCQPMPLDALFAYGTIMRGESRFSTVTKFGLECALLAEMKGTLTRSGEYPGLIADPQFNVAGDFYRSKDIGGLLEQLDLIESFHGFGRSDNLFRRTLRKAHVGGGKERLSWVYFICADDLMRSPGQDWRAECDRFHSFREAVIQAHAEADGFYEQLTRMMSWFNTAPEQSIPAYNFQSVRDDLERGALSERELAQVSGKWTALCGFSDGGLLLKSQGD